MRGGKRPGAGRPAGTTVLDAWEKIIVGAECQHRWRAELERKLQASQTEVFNRGDSHEVVARARVMPIDERKAWHSTYEGSDHRDDIEGAIKHKVGMPADSPKDAPRLLHIKTTLPYRMRQRILSEVAKWASHKFQKRVTKGLVDSAWKLVRRAERDV